jgi:hypothetical protein
MALTNVVGFGYANMAATYQSQVIRRASVTFANPAPDPFVFSASELTNVLSVHSIRLRAA